MRKLVFIVGLVLLTVACGPSRPVVVREPETVKPVATEPQVTVPPAEKPVIIAPVATAKPETKPAARKPSRTLRKLFRRHPKIVIPEINLNYKSLLTGKTNALDGWSFVLDPGHGGLERGAVSPVPGNSFEADLNLTMALLLGGMLQAGGALVHYTRTADLPVSDTTNLKLELLARTELSNPRKPNFFISIHHNGSDDPNKNQIEIYYKLFNQGLCPVLAENIGTELNQLYPTLTKLILPGNFAVLRNSSSEAVLIENCYLSNQAAADALERVTVLRKQAEAVCNAIIRYAIQGKPVMSAAGDTAITNPYLNLIPRQDTTPVFLAIFTETDYLDINIRDSGFIIRSIALSPALDITLKTIEIMRPDFALIVLNDDEGRLSHYFRSSTGKKMADIFSKTFRKHEVSPESHYLLTHTSMAALVIHTDFKEVYLPAILPRAIRAFLNTK